MASTFLYPLLDSSLEISRIVLATIVLLCSIVSCVILHAAEKYLMLLFFVELL